MNFYLIFNLFIINLGCFMIKFSNLSSISQVYNTLFSIYKYQRNIKKDIIKKSLEYFELTNYDSPKFQYSLNKPIMEITKTKFEGFEDYSCLARWGEVSDRQFGGSSKAQTYYNQIIKCLILKGKIDTAQRDKLQTIPFIGLLQKNPFSFKVGAFNSIRVQLIGDGKPAQCQISFFSPIFGTKHAFGIILTDKQQEWKTYQLPIINFQIKGEQITSIIDIYDTTKEKISKIIQKQYIKPSDFQLQKISFRLPSSQNVNRQLHFRKIQLVRTIRGNLQNQKEYSKPYFYQVNQNQFKDELPNKIKLGRRQYIKKK